MESGGKKSDQKEKAKGNKELKGKDNAADKEVKQKGSKVGNDTQSSSKKATMKRPSAAKDRVKNAHLHWRAHVPDSAKPRP